MLHKEDPGRGAPAVPLEGQLQLVRPDSETPPGPPPGRLKLGRSTRISLKKCLGRLGVLKRFMSNWSQESTSSSADLGAPGVGDIAWVQLHGILWSSITSSS